MLFEWDESKRPISSSITSTSRMQYGYSTDRHSRKRPAATKKTAY
jgi:hypothetical protein